MTPITSIDQITCECCIWSKTYRIDGMFCYNQPPCNDDQDSYYKRNPTSFCSNGSWIIKYQGRHHSVSRPSAMTHILDTTKELS